MKRMYIRPMAELVEFDRKDVITTSGDDLLNMGGYSNEEDTADYSGMH